MCTHSLTVYCELQLRRDFHSTFFSLPGHRIHRQNMAGVMAAAAKGMASQFSSTRVGDSAATAASAIPQHSHIENDAATAFSASSSTPSLASTLLYPAGSLQWLTTALVLLATLLVAEQYVYRYKKKHLPGATWTIPVIGKFADSLKPTMAAYHKTWSNPLSVASVFNM